jgi:ribonuclease E
MTKRMLIDAMHPEETRVVIAGDYGIEEFDFSSTSKKQNKGNIYLGKITRVEPSLQAAFVEYGAGKQGFLPFSEIHPDYYQLPIADRQLLLAAVAGELKEEAALEISEHDSAEDFTPSVTAEGDIALPDTFQHPAEMPEVIITPEDETALLSDGLESDDEEEEEVAEEAPRRGRSSRAARNESRRLPAMTEVPEGAEDASTEALPSEESSFSAAYEGENSEAMATTSAEEFPAAADASVSQEYLPENGEQAYSGEAVEETGNAENAVESTGNADEEEDERPRTLNRNQLFKRYKIQEVIKKNQIVLVQVIKEERGNKGASLTSYISLPGRYCVLMPNSPKEGGISRKISNNEDRKRLKKISEEMRTAKGMSVIIRTAGIDRTKAEIKRDFEYLTRLWSTVREQALGSRAPALIYEEGNLIKRSIRDLYTSDIEEVWVEGEEGYRTAKDFMKMIMPSHAPRVKPYKNSIPLFYQYDIEDQLLAMHEPVVKLKSGGYVVINTTEALVAIDVNSGKSTGERNIEETATKTNIEAAQEIARQLRLRDLAGLIVIDFIDMMDYRNRRDVERTLKDALKADRAKIQLSRISTFGLLEMSRQRLRPSISETHSIICPHCSGRGHIRSHESLSIQIMRTLEKEAAQGDYVRLNLLVPTEIALYLLNAKRTNLMELENRYGIIISIGTDETVLAGTFRLEKVRYGGEVIIHGSEKDLREGKKSRNRRRKKNGRPATGGAMVDSASIPYDSDEYDGEEEDTTESTEEESAADTPPARRQPEKNRHHREDSRRSRDHRRPNRQEESDSTLSEEGESVSEGEERGEDEDGRGSRRRRDRRSRNRRRWKDRRPEGENGEETENLPSAASAPEVEDAGVAAAAYPVLVSDGGQTVAAENATGGEKENRRKRPQGRGQRSEGRNRQRGVESSGNAAENAAPAPMAYDPIYDSAMPSNTSSASSKASSKASAQEDAGDADEGGEGKPKRRGWWRRVLS